MGAVIAELASQISHTHVETCAIAFALAFCYALWAGGALARHLSGELPAVPQFAYSLFPTKWDQAYTALFILFFAISSLSAGPEADEQERMTILEAVVLIAVQTILYAPMLVRFFPLKTWYRPRYSLLRGGLLVAGFLFVIFLCSGLVNASGITDWIVQLTGCPEQQEVVKTIKNGSDPVETATLAIAAILQAPVCEECAFRGFLYNILKRHSGMLCATLGSALFFAAVHASLPQLLPLFIFGVVQSLAYEKAKSLWLPICIHTAFNAINVATLLLQP